MRSLSPPRNARHTIGARAHSGPSTVDLGSKPSASEQPDSALELQAAEQVAINDAARGVYDAPGILGSGRPPSFVDRTRAWVEAEQSQERLRTLLNTHASSTIGYLIAAGRDEAAQEPGVGLAAWQRRLAQAEGDEAESARAVDDAKEDLAARGARAPVDHDRPAVARAWLRKWGLQLVAVVAEGYLVSAALDIVVRSENPAEKWGLAALILFGTIGIPHLVAVGLGRIRDGADGRWLWPFLAFGTILWLTLVFGVAQVRNVAAHTDLSNGGVSSSPAVQRAVGGAPAPLGTPADASSVAGTGQTSFFTLFLSMMLVMSAAVFLMSLLSQAPEELEYIRARRAHDRARVLTAESASAVALIDARLAYQADDVEHTQAAGDLYADNVLPALGALVAEEYTGELARQVGDAQFTDALRTVTPHPFARPRAGEREGSRA